MCRNKKAIGAAKVLAFLTCFLLIFQGATDLFRIKVYFYTVSPIYDLPKNSIDVLFFGTSHMNDTISPMDLWNDYGITSFNAAIGDQTIPATYFELRELLKVQRPKVIVLETYYICHGEMKGNTSEKNLHWLVDNVPLSFGVSESIQTLIPNNHDKTEYYLNFYSFHNRWKELSKTDFKPSLGRYDQGGSTTRGAVMEGYNLHSAEDPPMIISRDETKIPPKLPLEYLDKIIELCHENEIQLVFMAQPFLASIDIQKMMNYVDNIAEREKIPYLNFFYLLEEIGFDFEKDMAESSHINYFGVQKLTSYLADYLQTYYHLEDHRNDPEIAALWNKDYETFARELNNSMMKTAQTPAEYFDYLQNQDYILTWNAYSETSLSETALPELLENMGIEQNEMPKESRYYAVTRGDQLIHGKALNKKPDDSYMTDDTLFSFGSGITRSTNAIGIHVGRYEYSVGNTGLNLAIYDPVSRTVVDSVNIDLETGEIKRK